MLKICEIWEQTWSASITPHSAVFFFQHFHDKWRFTVLQIGPKHSPSLQYTALKSFNWKKLNINIYYLTKCLHYNLKMVVFQVFEQILNSCLLYFVFNKNFSVLRFSTILPLRLLTLLQWFFFIEQQTETISKQNVSLKKYMFKQNQVITFLNNNHLNLPWVFEIEVWSKLIWESTIDRLLFDSHLSCMATKPRKKQKNSHTGFIFSMKYFILL